MMGGRVIEENIDFYRYPICHLPSAGHEIMKKDCELLAICNLTKYNEEKKEAISMARTANVFARVEPEVKEQAEQVLDRLGIPMSNAVGMFLRQIVLQRGIPFEMKLPAYEEPVAYGSLTKEQFNAEIEKGMEDIKAGRVYSAKEIEEEYDNVVAHVVYKEYVESGCKSRLVEELWRELDKNSDTQ